jgi:hypothetical protein
MQNQSPINHETQSPTNQISNYEIMKLEKKTYFFKKGAKHYCNDSIFVR